MEQQFENLEALETAFQQRLTEAGDDEAAQLRVRADRGDALVAWNQRQEQQRQEQQWRTEALARWPHAMQQMVVGSTREAIEAAAQASHEHVQSALDAAAAQRAAQAADLESRGRSAYGNGSSTPAGGQPPVSPDPLRDAARDVQTELRKTTGYGARQQFDLRGKVQALEEAVWDTMSKRQVAAYARQGGGR